MSCRLARGWSTHKAVWAGEFTPPDGSSPPLAVVVKEGGLRYPWPRRGERGTGFDPSMGSAEMRVTMQTMFFEMAQEVLALELLAGHPGIPAQIGACVDAGSYVATSVQARAALPLARRSDLAAVCRGHEGGATLAALRLVRSILSLFYYLTEERYLRIEDLHWHLFDGAGNVRQNATDVALNSYAADDVSQFAIDSAEALNFQLIDLDKLIVNHDEQLAWYVSEVRRWSVISGPRCCCALLPSCCGAKKLASQCRA